MSNYSYSKKFNLSEFSDQTILTCLEDLNQEDWKDFLDDLILNPLTLSFILPLKTGESVLCATSNLFTKLGKLGRQNLIKALDSKVIEIIHSLEEPENPEECIINTCFYIIKELGEGIPAAILEDIITNEDINETIRESASLVLVNLMYGSSDEFWNDLDLNTNPFLLPAVITHFSDRKPMEVFRKLSQIKDDTIFSNLLYSIEYPIKNSITNLQKLKVDTTELLEIIDIIDFLPTILQEDIKGFSQYRTFLKSFNHGEISVNAIELDIESLTLMLPQSRIHINKLEDLTKNINDLKMVSETELNFLPNILTKLAAKFNESDFKRVQAILLRCLKRKDESIIMFRTLFDKSSLTWEKGGHERLIDIFSERRKIGSLLVEPSFFASPSKLKTDDFIELANSAQ